ncbi:MAG: zinc ribbon domain-containing protein [Acidobacteria bacterium]|nr:zinc ribbon domain-containing protein [Acidobacteriota bacterium]
MATASPHPKCPQCGAPIDPVEETDFLSCPFCGTRIFLDPAGAVLHLIVEPRIDAAKALQALARWLKNREVVGPIVPVASEIVFFPLWEVTARGAVKIVPGAGAIFDGLDRIQIPPGDAKIFSAERAKGPHGETARIVEASVPLEAALARAAAQPADAVTRLVHVPLVILSYTFFGAPYRAAVDASSGQIYPITVPRSAESRIDVAFAALLASGLVLNLIALFLLRAAPLLSLAILGVVSWGLYALGMKLAGWMES